MESNTNNISSAGLHGLDQRQRRSETSEEVNVRQGQKALGSLSLSTGLTPSHNLVFNKKDVICKYVANTIKNWVCWTPTSKFFGRLNTGTPTVASPMLLSGQFIHLSYGYLQMSYFRY